MPMIQKQTQSCGREDARLGRVVGRVVKRARPEFPGGHPLPREAHGSRPGAGMSAQPKPTAQKSVTLRTLAQMKREKQKITMVTSYDVTFARLLDHAGVDM